MVHDSTAQAAPRRGAAHWKALVARFQIPHAGRATWQLSTTLAAYLGTWTLIYFALAISWWLVLPLAVLGGLLLVRLFIIFHDCGHGSFFASRRANDFWGGITGLLAFTPYQHWRAEHAIHHGATGDLDRRGTGDVWTMTVQEYLESSRWKRFAYVLARSPVILFGVAPLVLFLFLERWPRKGAKPHEARSVHLTTLGIVAMVFGMSQIFGFVDYLLVQLLVLGIAGGTGIWLFYLQHQYEDAYWTHSDDWDYELAALKGSSFFRLPKVLQWFSGNIGFHHIHHLSPRIPNYNLERCHNSDPLFKEVKPMTLWSSMKSLRLRLWDEAAQKLVTFRQARRQRVPVRVPSR